MDVLESVIRQSLRAQATRAPAPHSVQNTVLASVDGSGGKRSLSTRLVRGANWMPVAGIVAAVLLTVVGLFALARVTGPSQPSNAAAGQEYLQLSTSDWGKEDDSMLQKIKGTVAIAENGCVYLQSSDGSRADIIWPAGWTVQRAAGDGIPQVLNSDGELVAQAGDEILSGGGGAGNLPLTCHASGADYAFVITDEVTVAK